MSIVTFWSNGTEQTGKSMSIVAIATEMAIEHNKRILIISTTDKSDTIENCFFQKNIKKPSSPFLRNTSGIETQSGMSGLIKVARSNKIRPDIIPNYTKVVFKDTLEILPSDNYLREDLSDYYPEIINLASQYYDLVLVDLDANIRDSVERTILQNSNVVVANISQRLSSIDMLKNLKKENDIFASPKTITLVGRFDRDSKYTAKNIARYIGERKPVLTIPYNTLFFESAEEAEVPDLFLKLRTIDKNDKNYIFLQEVQKTSEEIQYRLQDLQMRM